MYFIFCGPKVVVSPCFVALVWADANLNLLIKIQINNSTNYHYQKFDEGTCCRHGKNKKSIQPAILVEKLQGKSHMGIVGADVGTTPKQIAVNCTKLVPGVGGGVTGNSVRNIAAP
jgi:hypothetical protein